MQFLTSLFGGSDNTVLNSALALGIVLVLIVLGVWVLKLFTRASTTLTRGRTRRLKIVDTLMLDTRRQLLIVRRDDVEHLILTGGPQDVVVESGIAIAEAAGEPRALTQPQPADDDSTKPAPGVSRGAMERLRELARGEGTRPRSSLRHTGLLRPVSRQDPGVIPMPPELRVDNSAGLAPDSAKTGPNNGRDGQARLGGDARKFPRGLGPTDRS